MVNSFARGVVAVEAWSISAGRGRQRVRGIGFWADASDESEFWVIRGVNAALPDAMALVGKRLDRVNALREARSRG